MNKGEMHETEKHLTFWDRYYNFKRSYDKKINEILNWGNFVSDLLRQLLKDIDKGSKSGKNSCELNALLQKSIRLVSVCTKKQKEIFLLLQLVTEFDKSSNCVIHES